MKRTRSWSSNKIAPNQEQEWADPKLPGEPPKTKRNKFGAIYKSKPTSKKPRTIYREFRKRPDKSKKRSKFRHITREEQIALKEIRNWDEQTTRMQDKGSRFVILDNSEYEEKVQH